MLMKLRQGMFTEDIADRFDISTSLASNIITTWVKAASAVLKPTALEIGSKEPRQNFALANCCGTFLLFNKFE